MKNRKLWLVVAGIIVLVAAALWFAVANKDDMPSYSQPSTVTPIQNSESTDTAQALTPGTYVPYTAEAFAQAQGRRWLFFYAGWCPQCRALEKDIQQQGVPDGVTILKVNYDTETALKKTYNVTLQTTVVEVDQNGKEIQKFVAYDDPSLEAVMNALGG